MQLLEFAWDCVFCTKASKRICFLRKSIKENGGNIFMVDYTILSYVWEKTQMQNTPVFLLHSPLNLIKSSLLLFGYLF